MSANRGSAENQLNLFKKNTKESGSVTNSNAAPIGIRDASQTIGERGPILLQDVNLIDELAHFARERIPERVVHAKGAGAFGHFTVTHDITKYCAAKIFDKVGKTTPMAIRFSTVGGESGSADTVRDPRGFAMKFYTDDGVWDLVGNNIPIFFIRDPILFPSFIHTQKRNPQTHLKDPDMFWDFMSLRPETTHQLLLLFSDRGIPDGYRHMNGYGSHTYKMVNQNGEKTYVKFHLKTNQKIKNLLAERADQLATTDPDYSIRDLYNAIASGDFPSWSMYIQVMTYAQAEKFKFNPFDLTKVWSQKEYKLIPVGKFILDRNPNNYFTDVEQAAYAPSNLVPGIEASPDKMLQGRLFAYADTHRHRLGANHMQLPVNCPYGVTVKNYQRDGPQCYGNNQGGAPNYFPNSFSGPQEDVQARKVEPTDRFSGDVVRDRQIGTTEDYYEQAATFYNNVLNADERKRLYTNMGNHLAGASPFIQERAIKNLSHVSRELETKLTEIIKLNKSANL